MAAQVEAYIHSGWRSVDVRIIQVWRVHNSVWTRNITPLLRVRKKKI